MSNGQLGTKGPGNQIFTGLAAALINKVLAPLAVAAGVLSLVVTSPLRVAAGALELYNSGTTPGRANEPILIYSAALGITNTATWTAGAYKTLKFYVSSMVGVTVNAPLVLTGLVGTYTRQVFFNSAGSVQTANVANWDLGLNAGPTGLIGEFNIAKGTQRYGTTNSFIAAAQYVAAVYNHDDNTHDVTGFSLTLSSAPTAGGHIEVWGVPA